MLVIYCRYLTAQEIPQGLWSEMSAPVRAAGVAMALVSACNLPPQPADVVRQSAPLC